jgi:phage terminase large subunit-like protein
VRTYDELSLAEKLAKLPQAERDALFAGFSQVDYDALDFDWRFWGRPEQLALRGSWDNWLILAGRGFGKTRTGAEWVRANMCGDTPLTGGRWRHVALIAETAADARDVMVVAFMGVKAILAGVTLTAADITQAEALGIDAKGMMATAQAKCDDLKQMLGVTITDVLTPAGDSTNATTLTNQMTALS